MSSKRKSPPTKLEGGCQPTTTANIAHDLATFNQKIHDKDQHTLIKHTENELFTKQNNDCDIDEDIHSDIDNNDHNNNDDDANDNCDTTNVNLIPSEDFDRKLFIFFF